MELSLFNNKTTVNAHTQLLAVQQQQIHQAATAIDIYRHNKGNIGDFKLDFSTFFGKMIFLKFDGKYVFR